MFSVSPRLYAFVTFAQARLFAGFEVSDTFSAGTRNIQMAETERHGRRQLHHVLGQLMLLPLRQHRLCRGVGFGGPTCRLRRAGL